MTERRPKDRVAVAATAGRAGQVDDERRCRATPATPRESRPCGVFAIESARSACAIPGASRSSTVRVASGVTSRGAIPVPPVVSTSAARAGELLDRRGDLARLVGDDAPRDVVPVGSEQLRERVAARVLGLAARHAVGHGEHRRVHCFVFSTSSTSNVICLSIAFAMS